LQLRISKSAFYLDSPYLPFFPCGMQHFTTVFSSRDSKYGHGLCDTLRVFQYCDLSREFWNACWTELEKMF